MEQRLAAVPVLTACVSFSVRLCVCLGGVVVGQGVRWVEMVLVCVRVCVCVCVCVCACIHSL
jgi:hypothetical protein